MPHLEKAEKLLKSPKQRARLEKLFIDYFPDKGHKNFLQDETGGDADRETETEFDIGWHITLAENGSPILISHNATEFRIALKGEEGWANLEAMLLDYGKSCYSNKALKAVGSSLKPEEFEQLSEFLRGTEKEKLYVLAKQLKSRFKLYVKCMCQGKIGLRTLRYIKLEDDLEFTCSVRPIVLLPDGIQLLIGDKYYDGSTPERGLRIGGEEIIACVDKERRIDYLKREIKATTERLKELQRELSELENS